MNGRLTRLGLRSIAIAIAIAGLIDPAWTVERPAARTLVAIRMTAAPPLEAEQALRSNLAGWNVEPRTLASRLPCGAAEQCVVFADGSTDAVLPGDLARPLSLIALTSTAAPNVAVQSVTVSRAHQSAAGVAHVELTGTGVEGKRSEIRVLDGTAVIGATAHDWSSASSAAVDVAWWPIDTGARALRIEAVPVEGERTTIDNHIDAGVTVTATRAPVLVFDARPSWSSTFVRRAIEDDARFTVGYRTRLAPALSAGTANGRLDTAALDLASVVVIGGPDALTGSDVALLEQFVNVRGGTLVLLAERAPAGPWSRLLSGTWSEHLVAKPEAIGPLHASEILRTDRPAATATTVARSGSASAIVVSPTGNGRIVVSGAMDAWRYRDLDSGGFDKFWRSLIAEGAAWGEGVQLGFDRVLAARGSRARFTIRDLRMTPPAKSEANATMRCGQGPASAIRLWPAGAAGAFTGELPLAVTGSCTVEATINNRAAIAAIAVADNPSAGVGQTLAKLERAVSAAGGVVSRAGEEATLARAIASAAPPAPIVTAVHPMRAAWWMIPFAGCLSVEWWLRRRSGLR